MHPHGSQISMTKKNVTESPKPCSASFLAQQKLPVIMGPDAVRARFPVNGTARTAQTEKSLHDFFVPDRDTPNGGLACALAAMAHTSTHTPLG
jgi:hypothetical protein